MRTSKNAEREGSMRKKESKARNGHRDSTMQNLKVPGSVYQKQGSVPLEC